MQKAVKHYQSWQPFVLARFASDLHMQALGILAKNNLAQKQSEVLAGLAGRPGKQVSGIFGLHRLQLGFKILKAKD